MPTAASFAPLNSIQEAELSGTSGVAKPREENSHDRMIEPIGNWVYRPRFRAEISVRRIAEQSAINPGWNTMAVNSGLK